ncbi:MAG: TIGR02678 family protein [Solobacterium sp.]|nr:TIGR02678 family protein [Solobacterium sp.]MCI6877234.1 TIGR02678 family protein [Solobacterium sp.]MDD7776481.1 TIGR02678 family protein [Solobacterium sp.]MDY2952182.1 TIGR02678 family protein [Erysipelotrichaceae bacterium]MDY5277217.1 TIGR02678 family protein [Erysipelotrichaceae bacterium]
MTAIDLLLNNYWIIRDKNKDDYYTIKHEINDKNVKRFIQEMLGWKLIHTEHLIKLEKIPSHAEAFMGIQEFIDTKDYCFLCAVLMYLEDKEDNSQFLLSDLIKYVETIISSYMEVDWTSFSLRKSLVRVLQYVENKGMLKTYEGDSSLYSREQTSEVLYENTGLSRYFATNFPLDITNINIYNDFEKKQMEELEDDKGNIRTNRVFRQLVVCPSLYWDDQNNPDALYVKNKRNYIASNIEKNMDATLELSKNNASVVFVDNQGIGDTHPKTSMLSEIVLLVNHELYTAAQDKRRLVVKEDDTISISANKFNDILIKLKNKYQALWSKEYREMPYERYIEVVKEYMTNWLMIKETNEQIIIYPSCAITSGKYSRELEERIDEK